jgi:hypothetical protein
VIDMAFKGTTIPKLPPGFVDCSYGNDVCSHFEREWCGYIIEIWIEYDDKARRESLFQYAVVIRKPEECEFEEMVEFNGEDFTEAGLRAIGLKIHREVFKLMRKYHKEEL